MATINDAAQKDSLSRPGAVPKGTTAHQPKIPTVAPQHDAASVVNKAAGKKAKK